MSGSTCFVRTRILAGVYLGSALFLGGFVGSGVAQSRVDPYVAQVIGSKLNEGFTDLHQGLFELAKYKFIAAHELSAKNSGAFGSSSYAGMAKAQFALGDITFAGENAEKAIQFAQFQNANHAIAAFETRAHVRALSGNAPGAAQDYMSVVGLDPQQASLRYHAALDRCKMSAHQDLRARLEVGIIGKCPIFDPLSVSPQALAKWYPTVSQKLLAEQAEARRRAELAGPNPDPSAVPYMQGSKEAVARANIGFCNKSANEVRVAMIRQKGKFGGIFSGTAWVADGYHPLAPGSCAHRNFGYAEDFTSGYVSILVKRAGRWMPFHTSGTTEQVGRAEWRAHQRSICWPDSAELADPDRQCAGSSRNMAFTHWFSTSGVVRRLLVTMRDGEIVVETLSGT